jgi:Bifunctional DNA primase/polymerase, N-terminal
MTDVWPEPREGFGNNALEWWRIFNGLMPGGAWSFIRCEGKRPIERWPEPQRDVRNHINELATWRGNVGYVCGRQPSGWWLVVADVDPRTPGAEESLIALRNEGMTLQTVTVITGGEPQGQHFWFAYDAPVRKATFPQYPGIDFIAEGGMVMVPPSFTTHRYDFEYGWSLA